MIFEENGKAVVDVDLDQAFGVVRDAKGDPNSKPKADELTGRQDWEQGKMQASLTDLDKVTGASLRQFKEAAQNNLLRWVSKSMTFLWGVEPDGRVKIAVEEIASIDGKVVTPGFSSRREIPRNVTLDQKLGHPCLMETTSARIAGELYLDKDSVDDERLVWRLNDHSGRYHANGNPSPTDEQISNVARIFANCIGEDIEIAGFQDFPQYVHNLNTNAEIVS